MLAKGLVASGLTIVHAGFDPKHAEGRGKPFYDLSNSKFAHLSFCARYPSTLR
jgi:hypothetical protein